MNNQTHNLILALLREAGILETIKDIKPITEVGYTNKTFVVLLSDDRELVVREYYWPYSSPDLNRMKKEVYLHQLLQEHKVPVPHILASITIEDHAAILMEKISGKMLGDIRGLISEKEWDDAWESCGAALRKAHSIKYPPGTHGIIVGKTVESQADSWGHFHFYNVLHQANLYLKKQKVNLDTNGLQNILETAVPFLNQYTPTLLHNDPHPWNVMVDVHDNNWHCTGWLDWEYAWVGDPTWDLVRMDLFRIKSIGETPQAFYRGYGSYPAEPNRSIYELSIYLWQANEYLDGQRGLDPTHDAAFKYLTQIDTAIRNIQKIIKEKSN